MNQSTNRTGAELPANTDAASAGSTHDELRDTASRASYTTPRLERLGAWSALTLQQSIPIFP